MGLLLAMADSTGFAAVDRETCADRIDRPPNLPADVGWNCPD